MDSSLCFACSVLAGGIFRNGEAIKAVVDVLSGMFGSGQRSVNAPFPGAQKTWGTLTPRGPRSLAAARPLRRTRASSPGENALPRQNCMTASARPTTAKKQQPETKTALLRARRRILTKFGGQYGYFLTTNLVLVPVTATACLRAALRQVSLLLAFAATRPHTTLLCEHHASQSRLRSSSNSLRFSIEQAVKAAS